MSSTLRRQVSLVGGIAFAVGMVVGSGLFGLPGLALQIGSPQGAALGWAAGILAALPLVWVFAILGARYASAAGLARYAEAALGPRAEYAVSAALCGTFPLSIPALGMIGASYTLPLFGLDDSLLIPVAVLFLGSAVAFNIAGLRIAGIVNNVSLVLIVLSVIGLSIYRFEDMVAGLTLWTAPDFSMVTWYEVWKITALLFWAFLGWENLSFGLEEFRDPQRTIRRVYILSFVVVAILYVLLAATMNGAALAGADVDQTAGIAALVPETWRQLFTFTTVVIILANANAWVFGASRLFFAAARSGLLPAFAAEVDRRGTPRNAVLLLGACLGIIYCAVAVFDLQIPDLVLIVDQNFLVLYVICLYSYWRIASGAQRWLVTPLALVSCGFMLVGFSYLIIYPIVLLLVGMTFHRFRGRPAVATAAAAEEN